MTRLGRGPQRGQALVETAIVIVFAMTLFIGVYAVSVAISDSTTAGLASRSGARFAAQVGNNNYLAGKTDACQGTVADPCGVDKQIVATVAAGLQGLRFATIRQIVIYQPSSGAGTSCVNTNADSPYVVGDKAEIYTPSAGTWVEATPLAGAYSLDQRAQLHPNEGAIGVQVEFDYTSPTPMVRVTVSDHREYTVNCLAPTSQ